MPLETPPPPGVIGWARVTVDGGPVSFVETGGIITNVTDEFHGTAGLYHVDVTDPPTRFSLSAKDQNDNIGFGGTPVLLIWGYYLSGTDLYVGFFTPAGVRTIPASVFVITMFDVPS